MKALEYSASNMAAARLPVQHNYMSTEAREDGVLIRPAVVVPVERYTPERKAEFLLSTATTEEDYQRARKDVQRLGVDPEATAPPASVNGPLSGPVTA